MFSMTKARIMLPENVLLAGIVLLLLGEIIAGRARDGFALAATTLVVAAVAALSLHTHHYIAAPFPGHFSVGPTASLAKFVLIALTLPIVLISRDDFAETR
jgi:NADH:ubiquinone oxidoreductase subunit 2 (subunit N)